jgi:hypothetical protein
MLLPLDRVVRTSTAQEVTAILATLSAHSRRNFMLVVFPLVLPSIHHPQIGILHQPPGTEFLEVAQTSK